MAVFSSLSNAYALGVLGCFLVLASLYFRDRRRNPAGLPYPPGPKGYPIIGNLLDMPNAFIYKRFREMSRELGRRGRLSCRDTQLTCSEIGSDIIHLQVFGFHLIALNTKEVADDLFEKKSSIYSDR